MVDKIVDEAKHDESLSSEAERASQHSSKEDDEFHDCQEAVVLQDMEASLQTKTEAA